MSPDGVTVTLIPRFVSADRSLVQPVRARVHANAIVNANSNAAPKIGRCLADGRRRLSCIIRQGVMLDSLQSQANSVPVGRGGDLWGFPDGLETACAGDAP